MKLLIASDIHGSAYFCKKLLNAYNAEKADKLILLGDILYHGPRNDLPKEYEPKKVIEMLNNIKEDILCVRGNCDAEVDQMVLDFPILADYSILYYGSTMIYITHGHIYNSNNLPPMKKTDVLLHGHTHIPVAIKNEDHIYINPGSVSIPKQESPNGYIIFEDGIFIFKTLDMEEYMRFQIIDEC